MIGTARLPRRNHEPSQRATLILATAGLMTAMVAGYLVGDIGGGARLLPALVVIGALLAVLAWRYPVLPVGFLLLAGTLIEQFPITGDGTDQIPLFVSFSSALSLGGLYLTPVEVIFAVFLLITVMRAVVRRQAVVHKSAPLALILVLMAMVIFAEFRGLSRGGSMVDSLWEVRPWLYLFLAFIISAATIREVPNLMSLLWLFVLGTGIKGVQGTIRYFQLRHVMPRPESILAHEEAFFFGLFIILVIALWTFRIRGRLRVLATLLLPFVLLADLGNSRRTAFLILLAGVAVFLVAAWIRLPERRKRLAQISAAGLVLMTLYLGAFWNNYGTFGQPARAFRSAIAPSSRDKQSDQYRVLEDANLSLNIRWSAPLGAGFGVPIDYAIPIVDLSNLTHLIKFVPHDGLLYVWMRLGFAGAIIFWWLLAAWIFAAGRLLRAADPRAAMVGALVLCATVAYLIQGNYDYGLYWFRMAIFMGIFLGAVQGILSGRIALDRRLSR